VGSSAMPFKKNPMKSEQICSLARLVFSLSNVAAENAAHMLLERTLDDSANKRVYLPEMFLAIDEMSRSATKIVAALVINESKLVQNLAAYAPFAATEAILLATVKKGADRQQLHEVLRDDALKAWSAIQAGQPNPMAKLLVKNPLLLKYLTAAEITKLLDVRQHVGNAPQRAKKLVTEINQLLSKGKK
jgi:adenylosuccinate lyase